MSRIQKLKDKVAKLLKEQSDLSNRVAASQAALSLAITSLDLLAGDQIKFKRRGHFEQQGTIVGVFPKFDDTRRYRVVAGMGQNSTAYTINAEDILWVG